MAGVDDVSADVFAVSCCSYMRGTHLLLCASHPAATSLMSSRSMLLQAESMSA